MRPRTYFFPTFIFFIVTFSSSTHQATAEGELKRGNPAVDAKESRISSRRRKDETLSQYRILGESGHDHDHDHDHDHGSGDHADDPNNTKEEDRAGHENGNEKGNLEENNHINHHKPWGDVILYTILCNLTTFAGVLAFAPMLGSRLFGDNVRSFATNEVVVRRTVDIGVPAFASGALLATAFLLIMPEAMILISEGVNRDVGADGRESQETRFLAGEDGDQNEKEIKLKYGLSLFVGFLLPLFIGFLFPKTESGILGKTNVVENGIVEVDNAVTVGLDESKEELDKKKTADGEEELLAENNTKDVDELAMNAKMSHDSEDELDYKLIMAILIGDGFHNFGDGIFIGIGFMACSRTVAFSILGATIYHELAQEIADFLLLTQKGGLAVVPALVLNFVSGLSIILGGIVILSMDLSQDAIGIILSVAAGVYLHIAGSECFPRIDAAISCGKDKITFLFTFALGAIPIGLVLIDHEHCES